MLVPPHVQVKKNFRIWSRLCFCRIDGFTQSAFRFSALPKYYPYAPPNIFHKKLFYFEGGFVEAFLVFKN